MPQLGWSAPFGICRPRGSVLVLVCAIVVTIAVAKVFFGLAHVSAGRDVADRRDPNMVDINAAWG